MSTKGLYFIHGTWGKSETWYDNSSLISEIKKIFNYNLSTKEVLFDWSGGNLPIYRKNAAKRLMNTIIDDINFIINNYEQNKLPPLTLIGHSHGGTVAILALNMGLAYFAYKKGFKINLITLNTPVIRNDNNLIFNIYGSSINKIDKKVLTLIKHYHFYTKDFIQHRGGASYIAKSKKKPIGIGWQNGGTKSKKNDYKKNILGAGYRTFKNNKTINIFYKGKFRIYFNKKYSIKMNLAGITGHQGWRREDTKEWLKLLEQILLAK